QTARTDIYALSLHDALPILIASAEIGESEGTLKKKETLIIKNLLRLDKIYTKDVLTPRSVLVALPKHLTVKEVIEKFSPIPFSRDRKSTRLNSSHVKISYAV